MALSQSAAGAIDCELSYTDFEPLLRSAICAGAGLADTPSSGITRYLNGSTLDTYYFEKQHLDVGTFTGVYGAVLNEMNLTFEANAPVGVQLGVLAQKMTKESATRSTALTEPSTDAVMRSGADVASISLGGSAIAAAVQRLVLNIRNNITPRSEVTADAPAEMMPHSFEVSGSMLVYFPTVALYDDILANTARALAIPVATAAGSFTFRLPAIKLVGGGPTIPAQNQDVMLEIPFLAERGTLDAAACTMALDVDPA